MMPVRRPERRDATAGATLVEVLVALVLFALIGGAGFSVLDQVIRVQSRTEGRLDRVAQMQRAMQLLTLDFMLASRGSLVLADGAVSFRRNSGAEELAVRYGVEDESLVRSVSGKGSLGPTHQVLLSNVKSADWQFFDPASGWVPTWPPASEDPVRVNPGAVAIDVVLDGPAPSGNLRRIAILPQDPAR
jgi:general secretion pathway protein J